MSYTPLSCVPPIPEKSRQSMDGMRVHKPGSGAEPFGFFFPAYLRMLLLFARSLVPKCPKR